MLNPVIYSALCKIANVPYYIPDYPRRPVVINASDVDSDIVGATALGTEATMRTYHGLVGLAREPIYQSHVLFYDPEISGFSEGEMLKMYRSQLKSEVYEKRLIQKMSDIIAKQIMLRRRMSE